MAGFLPPGLQAEVVTTIGRNFPASRYGVDSTGLPGDGNGAVGPAHFVELINGRFSVYDKATGGRVASATDLEFWKNAGAPLAAGWIPADPRVVYDAVSHRWFASMIDFDPSGVDPGHNHFLLAVSATPDPAGSWTGFKFPVDPTRGFFGDFPTLGIDAKGVYLSADMFDLTGRSVGPTLVTLPKKDLVAASPTIANRKSFGQLTYAARGYILQPAVATGSPTTTGSLLATADLGYDFADHTTLFLSTVVGVDTPATETLPAKTVITVPAYTSPINPIQPSGYDGLDDGDARFSACVRRVGDILYAVHGTEVGDRAAIRWYRINALNGALLESGTLSDPELDLFYPSIAANEAGVVVIAYNGCSPTTYISAYAVTGQPVGGTLQFGPPLLLVAGLDSYDTSDPSSGDPTSRWGDYSATTVDPEDPNRFWTIQTYPVDAFTWATQVTELITGPASLRISQEGAQLAVRWPFTAVGYELQVRESLDSAAPWKPATVTPEADGPEWKATLPALGDVGYYRLAKP